MDWKQFIANLVASLAWPTVAIIFLCVFRKELSKIVQRLTHFKYKDLEMDFDKVIKQAKGLPDESKQEDSMIKSPVFSSLEDQILEAVERSPSASILLAWSAVESAVASAVARMAISSEPPSYRSPMHNIDMLNKHGGLSKKHETLLQELRMLRNKVAHEHNAMLSITQDQALNYATIAIDMINHLERMQREGK
ncbi:MAG TPA: hypothetical protein PLV42_00295 [bacterium]|nr:hypothetical protein [bacterium]